MNARIKKKKKEAVHIFLLRTVEMRTIDDETSTFYLGRSRLLNESDDSEYLIMRANALRVFFFSPRISHAPCENEELIRFSRFFDNSKSSVLWRKGFEILGS